jgi:hypothetical protein
MNDVSWIDCVRTTLKADEVLQLSRLFVGSWDPMRLAELPPSCLPPPLASYDNISAYAVTLMRAQLARGRSPIPDNLDRMCAFFAAASMRLAEILGALRHDTSRAFLRPLQVEEE